jgi:tetratricopeptide (TPR) repeat protein
MRDLPERHRSMRATLDHSWKLLNAEEKLILSRLSVFQGSFRRESAKEICGASLTVLSSLNNKMLLRRTDPVHYALHELIRQYAGLKLAEDVNESERIKDQHSLYFAQRLSEWEKALKGSLQVETLNEMAQKIDNLRQGWQRMVCACQDYPFKKNRFSPELFHSSLFSLSLFYETRFRYWEAIDVFTESMECLKSAQSTFEQDGDRSYFCAILGQVMAYLGLHHSYILQYQQAHAYLNEAIRLLQNDQTRVERAQAQVILARIYSDQGQLHKSAALLEQARDIFQQEGDTWWYLKTLLNLAWINLLTGKIQEGKSLYQECSRLVNPNDLRLGLLLRNGSAYARYLQNDFAGAEQLLHENLQQSYQLGFKRQTALTYLDLGQVALDTNRIELAEDYFQESVDLFSEYGNFHNLAALGLLYSGKCLMIRQEIEAARENFLRVIKIGQTLDTSYLVYWGLVNLARTYMIRGKTEKALKMALVLLQYPVEYKKAHDDGVRLIADLQAMLPPWQIEDAMDQAEGKGIETLLDLIEKS